MKRQCTFCDKCGTMATPSDNYLEREVRGSKLDLCDRCSAELDTDKLELHKKYTAGWDK